jgi:hypothetical protein
MARKYGPKAQKEVKEAMHEFIEGKLKSGKSGKKVTNSRQAVAIGLSKALKDGCEVPLQEEELIRFAACRSAFRRWEPSTV